MSVHPIIRSLLADIAAFRARTGMSVTAFGLESIGDPHLIRDLKGGRRNFGVRTLERIRSFMERREGNAA